MKEKGKEEGGREERSFILFRSNVRFFGEPECVILLSTRINFAATPDSSLSRRSRMSSSLKKGKASRILAGWARRVRES